MIAKTADILLSCLQERIFPEHPAYLPKVVAYRILKKASGKDFGDDLEAWKTWVYDHNEQLNQIDDSVIRFERQRYEITRKQT